jgi:hypothetical protein
LEVDAGGDDELGELTRSVSSGEDRSGEAWPESEAGVEEDGEGA